MSEWLTTGQMIDRLKVGEVAEGVEKGFYSEYQVRKTEYGEIVPVKAKGLENSNFLTLNSMAVKTRWQILPKYVSFEEARKAYEEGKTIKCEYDGVLDRAKCYEKFALNKPQYEGSLSFYMIIEGKWTIEE